MPLDPNIYSQLQPNIAMGIGDVINRYVDQTQADAEKKNRLAQMAQAGELQGLQLQQAKQQAADEAALRQAYKESAGDTSGMVQKLRAQGLHAQADQLIKAQAEQQKANMEFALKRHEGLATTAGDIANNPTQWQAVIQNSVKSGMLHPDDANTMIQHFSTLPPEQIAPEAQKGMVMVKDASAQMAKELYTKPDWKLVETEGGQQFVNPNAPNAPKVFGPKPKPDNTLVAVIGPDGVTPILVKREQAAGMTPFNKAAASKNAPMTQQQKDQATLSAQQAIDQAAKIYAHPGKEWGTGKTSFLGSVPGTDTYGFKANLETFKAQTFIPMVQALKGMGALSDAEGKKLSDSIGALNPGMKKEEFDANLKEATKYLFDKAKASGLDVTLPAFAQTQNQNAIANPDIEAILNKHGVK